ncbi:MAG: phosphate propanoyltransferase [archaeon]
MVSPKKIKIEVSNRHIHLSRDHLDILFGERYELNKHRDLSQIGEFSAQEKVILVNQNKKIENVRVLGPPREKSQVEISKTDALYLDLSPPIRHSGKLENSPGIKVVGPKGIVKLEEGVIISHRHIHVSDKEAEILDLQHGQIVRVKVSGEREVIFNNVSVRVSPRYRLAIHIDTDDSKNFSFERGMFGEIINLE